MAEKMVLQRSEPSLVQQFHNTEVVRSEREIRELKARIKAAWEAMNSEVETDGE